MRSLLLVALCALLTKADGVSDVVNQVGEKVGDALNKVGEWFGFGSESKGEDAVVVLTDSNFDEFVKEHDKVLVEFYAPWCGHCKQLEPEYKKAAAQLKEDGATTVLAKVDATAETKLAKEFEIRGFPTMKYFTKGVAADYGGGRSEDTIVSWIKKRELPAVSSLASKEEADKLTKGGTLVAVGFFAEGSDEAAWFKGFADSMRDNYVFGHVSDAAVAKEMGATMPGFTLYREAGVDEADRKFESTSVSLEKFDEESIKAFLSAEQFPLIDEIGPENYKDYMDRGLPLVWIAIDPKDADGKAKILGNVAQASKDFKGKLSFTYVDGIQYEGHVKNLGIASTPGLVVVNNDSNEKFKFDGDITSQEDVDGFFKKYGAGEISPYFKSQPVPESNDEGVQVLVGENFKEVAFHQEKAVLVEFYAPWCGHCKKLAPEYEKVGEHFGGRDDVVVAKLDATENDTPEDISGFPTLVFYGKGAEQGSGERYEGARTADGIIKFLEDKAPASAGGDADAGEPATEASDAEEPATEASDAEEPATEASDAEEPSSVDAGEPATEEPAAEETAGEAGEGHDEL